MKLDLLSAALISAALLTTPAMARKSQVTPERLAVNANARIPTGALGAPEQACCKRTKVLPGANQLTKPEQCLPFECVALLLQGGGALGAYQGGVYEALAEANIHPDWIAGISIGAINGAIIAGNPPHSRVGCASFGRR